jgi:hypothetical protein
VLAQQIIPRLFQKDPRKAEKNPAMFTKARVWLIHNYAAIKFSFPFII